MALSRIKASLNDAAYEYAHASVGAAQEAYTAATDAAPCVAVFRSIVESQQFAAKSHEALQSCFSATALLLKAEEVVDPEVNKINAVVKVETVEQHVISAMLEAAAARIAMAKQMLPENPAPGARCIPPKEMQ